MNEKNAIFTVCESIVLTSNDLDLSINEHILQKVS